VKDNLIILLFVFLLIGCTNKEEANLEDKMQMVLDKGLARHGAKGASAAIINADGHLWTVVSGISHDTVPINEDMIFAIGSVTKNIVAALALRLAEDNLLSLNDPLSKWLPDYPFIDNSITIRQLLNHTSGIYMFWENDSIWKDLQLYREKHFEPEDVLGYIKEPDFSPGDGWRYSNTNYLLAAMIIEKATGSQLAKELRNRFWNPLGIENVWLSQQEQIPLEKMAHIYGDDNMFGAGDKDLTYEPRISHESIGFGSSGVFIAPRDLAYWCHQLFEGNILQGQSMNEMLQLVDFRPIANMTAYGLGVQQYDKRFSHGKTALGHGGGNIGSTTYMMHLPDYHLSLVVSINAFPNQGADYIAKGLLKAIFKDTGELGIFPYIPLFPNGILLMGIMLSFMLLARSLVLKIKK